MAEYALPAVLIGMVVVAGLTWTLNGEFASQGGRSLFQAETSSVGPNGKALLNSRSFGKNPYLQTYTLTLANGKTIQIPDMPISVTDNIDVDGGHGTTEKLLAALEKLRKALVEAGELTEADSQPFKDLANAGHGFGQSQKIIESAAGQCGQSKECFLNFLHKENGELADELVLSRMISSGNQQERMAKDIGQYGVLEAKGIDTLNSLSPGFKERILQDIYYDNNLENLRVGPNLAQFVNAYHKLINLPVLKDKILLETVRKLSGNILTLQEASLKAVEVGSERTFQETLLGVESSQSSLKGLSPENYIHYLKTQVNHFQTQPQTYSLSDSTHRDAKEICNLGNRTDDGRICF